MKQYIQALLVGAVIMGLLPACYKDKGNYDLIEYNKILSINAPTTGTVILGDTLRLNPIIKWQYPDRDTMAFEYEWRQVDSVVSTSRNLAYPPDISGYFNIFLYIKEKATGIVTRYAQQIQAQSAYKAGWLLLTNEGGKSGLTFIRRDAKKDANNQTYYVYKEYPNIYENLFPNDPLGDEPVKLATKVFPDYSLDEVVVLQGNSTLYLNGDNFSKKISMRNEFPGRAFPNNAKVVDYVDGFMANFALANDGKMYWKRNLKNMGGLHDGFFLDEPIYFENGGAYISQIIDGTVDLSNFVYVYDSQNKRLMGVYTSGGGNDFMGRKMFLNNATPPPAGWVDLNNLTGYTLTYSSDHGNGTSYMNILKNDGTGQYIYQNYSLTNVFTAIDVSNQQQEVFAGSAFVNDNTAWFRIRNSSYLFFGTGSKLYFYDVNTKKVTLYHDFGSGDIVKMTTDAVEGELGVAFSNGQFVIVSLKNEVLGNANPGSVGILYQSPFTAPIVDLAWKWGSYFEYVFKRYPQ
jgi:hypothetical protein